MRRMRVTCSAMPPRMVTAPPLSPVPAPRGTTGTLCLDAIFITSATCCVFDASTTASGLAPAMEPSRSKMRRSLAASITDSRPTARRSSSTTGLASGILERLETARHGPGEARRFGGPRTHDQEAEPLVDLVVGRHAVAPLEDRFLDAVVRRDLDRVPDRQAVRRHDMVRLVHLAIDGKAHRLRLGRGAQPRRLARDVGHQVHSKLETDGKRKAEGGGRARDG